VVAETRVVSPSYFETLGIPLMSGDMCRQSGISGTEVVVNRRFVERYFPQRSPVGLHIQGTDADAPPRIVGVVGDARELGTDLDATSTLYYCFNAPTASPWYLVRANRAGANLVAAIRVRLAELEPLRAVYDVEPLEQRIGAVHAQNRLRTLLVTMFALMALALTSLGVYGTLTYVVSLRRR